MPKKTEIVEMPDSLAFSIATENVNDVPARAWRKWNNQARYVFNDLFRVTECQQTMMHPRACPHTDAQWKTIRWNMAWLAADAVMATVKK